MGKVKCPVEAFSLETRSRTRTLALEALGDHVVQFTLLPVRKLRSKVLKSRGQQPREPHSMPARVFILFSITVAQRRLSVVQCRCGYPDESSFD